MPERGDPSQPVLIIKKYPNRKLYNTQTSTYLTLSQLAVLVRQEVEVKVIDHASGEDLTAVTLSQLLVDQERKGDGNLTVAMLSALVNAGGDIFAAATRAFQAPFDLSTLIDDEIERRIKMLISINEFEEQEGSRIAQLLKQVGQQHPAKVNLFENIIGKFIKEHGFASRLEVQELIDRLDSLTRQVDEIQLNKPNK